MHDAEDEKTLRDTVDAALAQINEKPEIYELIELYRHLLMTGILVWGIPKEEADVMWEEVLMYIKKIPAHVIEEPWQ